MIDTTCNDKMVMFDSPEAATFRTDIKGWVSRDGQFYGDDPGSERGARWSGCTHQTCECGTVHEKSSTACPVCISKARDEKYYALPMVDWDETTPICVFDDDRYFFNVDSVLDWMTELKSEADKEGAMAEVQLVLCTPLHLHQLEEDVWADELPEDGELPEEVAQKLAELNEAIKRAPVVSWWAGKTRINVDALWARVELVMREMRDERTQM